MTDPTNPFQNRSEIMTAIAAENTANRDARIRAMIATEIAVAKDGPSLTHQHQARQRGEDLQEMLDELLRLRDDATPAKERIETLATLDDEDKHHADAEDRAYHAGRAAGLRMAAALLGPSA